MVVDGPALIVINGSILITVDAKNNITIDGHEKVKIRVPHGDLDLDAKNISINAKEELYIGTGKEVRIQSKKINLNPKKGKGGYNSRGT